MARGIHTFTARFESEAQYCGHLIEPGDEVAYIDDEIACEQCVMQAQSEDVDG